MFGNRKGASISKRASATAVKKETVKYPKPKILLIDMPDRCADVLRCAGYTVTAGSFGTPYRVERSDKQGYVSLESRNLPNCSEQEIIIANTRDPPLTDTLPSDQPGEGVETFWQGCQAGFINPRPVAMRFFARDAFDKIFLHGGIFIVQLVGRQITEYRYGPAHRYGGLRDSESINLSNWGFLTELSNLRSASEAGFEISFNSAPGGLGTILKRADQGAQYHSLVSPDYDRRDQWIELAGNKYGETVAGLLAFGDPNRCLIALPQMPAIDTNLVALIEEWCSQWNPALFPDLEGARWVHRPELEIPKIVELQSEIEHLKEVAQREVVKRHEEIAQIQKENQDWYALLRGSGTELVQAVIHSLKRVGFQQVVDVDAEARTGGTGQSLREDIQIRDRTPILVIDVKGVNGCPDDDESRQAEKHATMRMREWKTADVQPLSIRFDRSICGWC